MSLGDSTDKPTCKKNICKAKNGPELAENDLNLIKGIQYNPTTFDSFVNYQISSLGTGWR